MDTVPHIKAAGYTPPLDRNSTAHCVQPDLDPSAIASLNATLSSFTLHPASSTSPSTLAAIDPHYKYRRTFQTQPGLRFIHPGLVHDSSSSLSAELRHGVTTKQSLTAADVLASASTATSPLSAFLLQQKESSYLSNKVAPLGHSLSRGHTLPAVTTSPQFRFGLKSKISDDAKQLIYAPTAAPKEARREEQKESVSAPSTPYYNKHRHGSTKALTRQEEEEITHPTHRLYDWQSHTINPNTFAFGLPPPPAEPQQVKRALTFEGEEKETVLMSVKVEEYERRYKAKVGEVKAIESERVKALHADDKFRFGMTTGKDEWDAKKTLKGEYSAEEQKPDADLGKVQKHSTRLTEEKEQDGDSSKVFGLPSIRYDRSIPAQKSVANACNYGDEGTSKQLLYPSPYASFGLHDEHFLQQRPEGEIRQLYERMGVVMKDRQWQVVCSRAVRLYGGLSVDSVRHAINRQEMERACSVCGAIQCQHVDCVQRACVHDGMDGLGNHRRFMTHDKVCTPLRRPAGATGTGYTPMEKAVSR